MDTPAQITSTDISPRAEKMFVACTWLLSCAILVAITARLFAIAPLYTSGQVRSGAIQVWQDLSKKTGLGTSKLWIEHVTCTATQCTMTFRQIANSPFAPTSSRVITTRWPIGSPQSYEAN